MDGMTIDSSTTVPAVHDCDERTGTLLLRRTTCVAGGLTADIPTGGVVEGISGAAALRPTPSRAQRRQSWLDAHPVMDGAHQLLVAVVGLSAVLLGLVLVPLPGPGWVVVFAGLTILSRRFTWARRARTALQTQLARCARWFTGLPLGLRALTTCLSALAGAAGTWACLAALGLPAWLPSAWTPALRAVPGW